MEAYRKEYQGCKDTSSRDAVRVVIPPRSANTAKVTTRSNKVYFRNEKNVYVHKGISKLMELMIHTFRY